MSITIDGGKVDFAEAALLIQGSACIYSKKVCLQQVVQSNIVPEFPLDIFGAGHRGRQDYILPANQLIYQSYYN